MNNLMPDVKNMGRFQLLKLYSTQNTSPLGLIWVKNEILHRMRTDEDKLRNRW